MAEEAADSAAYVLHLMRERIVAGHYAPHSLLPSQRQRAEELRVGRAYVRKALAELSRAGLVQTRQEAATQVLSPGRSDRPVTTLAFVHSPIGGWISHEGAYLAAGITDRLRALGYPYGRHACVESLGDAGPVDGAADALITPEQVCSLPDRCQGAVFLECATVASAAPGRSVAYAVIGDLVDRTA